MAEKVLVVIDMQNDFVDGSLGTKEAQAIVPNVVSKVKEFDGVVYFTQDTHQDNYSKTQEGRMLPVNHCIEGTYGWQLIPLLEQIKCRNNDVSYTKGTFGSTRLANDLKKLNDTKGITSVELIGVCTDICVVSNALLIKANMPEVPIYVDASCCAGVTPDKHMAALEVMKSCQIIVK